MNDLLKYKGYFGSVAYSAEDRVLWGKIEFINDLITFEAATAENIEKEFQDAVTDYIETCKKLGKTPQKSFRGQFNVRIKPELHKKAAIEASKRRLSLNSFVEKAIADAVTY